MARESVNALHVIRGIPKDKEHQDGGAAVPLLLDMGLTPLDTKNFKSQVMRIFDPAKLYEHECNSDPSYKSSPGFYVPKRKYVWYPRAPDASPDDASPTPHRGLINRQKGWWKATLAGTTPSGARKGRCARPTCQNATNPAFCGTWKHTARDPVPP